MAYTPDPDRRPVPLSVRLALYGVAGAGAGAFFSLLLLRTVLRLSGA